MILIKFLNQLKQHEIKNERNKGWKNTEGDEKLFIYINKNRGFRIKKVREIL